MNHRLAHYKSDDKAIFCSPKPYDPGQGWKKTDERSLEPVSPYSSPSLIDLLEKTLKEVEEEVGDDEQAID